MRNGHGTLYFKDGGHYEGEWKDDKMHGFGKLYYENGSIAYEGHW
jgi:antitoxin component YwqK of YwqJK toxin-antitoxin module